MKRRRQDLQHEVLTPEVVKGLREAVERNYRAWWVENFGHHDNAAWDRYLGWLLEQLPKTRRVWNKIYG